MSLKSETQTEQKYDDLTAIKGIKQARQQWFRETFNVRTFRDLAALSVDEIESRLKAEKQIPSRNKIESWLAEAKQFAENPGLVTEVEDKLSTKREDWKPFASFVVEFQEHDSGEAVEVRTRVHHIESDQTRTWTGVDQGALCQWITQQLGDKAKPPVVELKPAAAEMVSTPESLPATPIIQPAAIQADQPIFSDRLQHIMAIASRTSQSNTQMIVTPTSTSGPSQPKEPSNEYSDKLQQLIAKVQRLSSQNHEG